MSTILEQIEQAGYLPNKELFEQFLTLTRNVGTVQRGVHSSYWNILKARSLKDGNVESAHNSLYPLVVAHCTTKDMTAKERNAATNFARSAYSTLRSYNMNVSSAWDMTLTKTQATKEVKKKALEAKKKVPSSDTYYRAWNALFESINTGIPLTTVETDLFALLNHRKAMETK